MLAVRWHARGDVRVEEVPPPGPPGQGDVQLAVSWCGICGTDLEEWLDGPVFIPVVPHSITGALAPVVLGHEFAGVVTALGDGVTGLGIGERVAVDTIVSCGRCRWCRRGEVSRCPELGALGLHADGGHHHRGRPYRADGPRPRREDADRVAVARLGRGLPHRAAAARRGAVAAAPLITDRIPLAAALTGGLALLKEEPEKHVKILVRSGEGAAG